MSLPQGCPVKPAGITKTGAFFLKPSGETVELTPQCSRDDIVKLFDGDYSLVVSLWPRYDRYGVSYAAHIERARHDLFTAALEYHEDAGFETKALHEASLIEAAR